MKKFFFIISILFICFTFTGCEDNSDSDIVSATHFCLDTEASITIYHMKNQDKASKIINECFLMCDEFEQEISRTIDTSDISKINTHSGKNVTVNKETYSLITDSLYFSEISKGAFDITIAPIVNLWNIRNNTGTIPQASEIKKALSFVNYKKISLHNNAVSIPKKSQLNKNREQQNGYRCKVSIPKGFQLDLGGIAKGYLADKIKKYMKSRGVTSAIINLGGNILTIGKKSPDTDFSIGIQKPFSDDTGNYSAKISINDQSVVTSGIYQRYFEKNGKIYHHIFNPKTGFPTDNNLFSVSIISDSSEDGDALSTAALVSGRKKGLQLINSLDNIEAVFIDENYNITLSDGLTISPDKTITYKKQE